MANTVVARVREIRRRHRRPAGRLDLGLHIPVVEIVKELESRRPRP